MKRKQVTRVKEYRSVTHKFKCAALAPESQLIATGDSNNTLNLWSFTANAPVVVGTIHFIFVNQLCFLL